MSSRLALLLSFLSVGCSVAWKPLDPAALKQHPAATVGVVDSKPEPFYVRTAGASMFGLVGLAVMAVEGEHVIKDNHLSDPSLAVATRLWQVLAARHALVPRTPKARAWKGQTPIWDTDLILKVTTTNWSVFAFPGDWTHYRLFYQATLELTDSRDGKVLASGECEAPYPKDSTGAPSFDQLVARQASLLRQKMNEAAAFCANKYARELFGVRLPEDLTPEPVPEAKPSDVYAGCNLEGTPAWKAADPAEKHRLLEQCQEERRTRPVTPPAPVPAAATPPAAAAPSADPDSP